MKYGTRPIKAPTIAQTIPIHTIHFKIMNIISLLKQHPKNVKNNHVDSMSSKCKFYPIKTNVKMESAKDQSNIQSKLPIPVTYLNFYRKEDI